MTTYIDKEKALALAKGPGLVTDAIIDIFKLAIPEWDNVKTVYGYVHCSTDAAEKLMREFFERKGQGNAAFMWMNYGFIKDEGIVDDREGFWTIEVPELKMREET